MIYIKIFNIIKIIYNQIKCIYTYIYIYIFILYLIINYFNYTKNFYINHFYKYLKNVIIFYFLKLKICVYKKKIIFKNLFTNNFIIKMYL